MWNLKKYLYHSDFTWNHFWLFERLTKGQCDNLIGTDFWCFNFHLFSGKLKNLKEIDASKNQIQEFPVSLATLARLNSIDLNENKIKNIPDGVDGLQITELSLNQNQISSISPGMYSGPILNSQFWNDYLYLTVWTFHDFSVAQILREIIFGESRRSKIVGFFLQF